MPCGIFVGGGVLLGIVGVKSEPLVVVAIAADAAGAMMGELIAGEDAAAGDAADAEAVCVEVSFQMAKLASARMGRVIKAH
jgi:hypothetical protein